MPESLETTYLIIGGGIAGTTAAETLRKQDPKNTITIVSDEPHRLYSRIMLSKPNYFLGKIPEENIWLKTEAWYTDNNISLIKGKSCINLDAHDKKAMLDNGTVITYEKLLLAIGGCARQLGVPGANKKGVHVLRTLDEARAIIEGVKTGKKAVVIGGGFVGFEMCDMLKLAGLDVTLLLREPYFWENMLDKISGEIIESALEKGGVKILRNEEAAEIIGNSNVTDVKLKSNGARLPCDMIIVGIGIVCPVTVFAGSGINIEHSIITDEYLETNISSVWAAGDAAKFKDIIHDEYIQLGNWANAQKQGKVAAINMTGGHEVFKAVSFYTTLGFGITIAFVGNVRMDETRKVIARGPKNNSYGRIILKDGKYVVGATLINRTPELAILSKLIENKIDMSGHKESLSDPDFNISALLPS